MPLRETVVGLVVTLAVTACVSERERGDGSVSAGVHPDGFAATHGAEVAARGWDLTLCASCHGEDFSGGGADVSCLDCHEDGPTACDTCHEATPTTAAHPRHIARYACAECHDVPDRWDAPGHILNDTAPPEAFGYDADTGRCGVTCHGDAQPRWTGGPAEAACGTCHGAPPEDHAWDRCETCHPADAPHVDGTLAVRDTCDSCHGADGVSAPPVDLFGNMFTTASGVGAHRSHLDGPARLALPVPCTTCHVVPADRDDAGHLDTAPPAEVAVGAGWDGTTCTNACHGSYTPTWTAVGVGEASCGTCHAVPPPAPWHDGAVTLQDCNGCHPATIDSLGRLLLEGHINGHVDVDL